ncbi:SiaB family protein kinase [Neopusillimonas aestuarii]|uniref:SiaB family protein kinase n=1 Tax=Neopusillimonas aestuarii TaxID=2716226 RepID=UPI00197CFF29|nr:SiaB family protein kinase [Pusillimonas sp. DMV24BSW_D]
MNYAVLTQRDNTNLHWRIFCECAQDRNVIFYYEGYFSQTIIAAVSDAVKMRTEQVGAANTTRRKLFSSFIEMTQNIIHYSVDAYVTQDNRQFNNEVRHGSICISTQAGRFYLHCANPVNAAVAHQLQQKLEHLRSLTIDDIKREYKRTLRSETPDDSKGAGLGLLTVARDASAPLEFEFTPIENSDHMLFYLKATI